MIVKGLRIEKYLEKDNDVWVEKERLVLVCEEMECVISEHDDVSRIWTESNNFTHIPKYRISINDNSIFIFKNNTVTFNLSYDSKDLILSQFHVTSRHKEKRIVWIFKGKSNSGKTFLSSQIYGLSVYETDSKDTLPAQIPESIIVLGNKYPYTVEQVKKRIVGDPEIQIVNFEK